MSIINLEKIKESKQKANQEWYDLCEKLIQGTLEANAEFDKRKVEFWECAGQSYEKDDKYLWCVFPDRNYSLYEIIRICDLNEHEQKLLHIASRTHTNKTKLTFELKIRRSLDIGYIFEKLKEQFTVEKRILKADKNERNDSKIYYVYI